MSQARVAVVGAGPSGFYAAQALLAAGCAVDVLDRLPTPYGLVRGGVAPDHQKIKTVVKAYEKVAAEPGFRFFGNVRVGSDITADELLERYDQVVYAVGAESANRLGIPGEDLEGSHSATAFVGWYNSHPDHAHRTFDLSVHGAAVVGVGNVSMDVSRVLAAGRAHLGATDIADTALDALERSAVTDVWILGRRGPAQAAFTAQELQEIAALPGVDLRVRPDEVALDPQTREELASAEANLRKNVAFLEEQAARPAQADARIRIHLRFWVSPVALVGADGRVVGMRLERNAPVGAGIAARASGTGQVEEIPVGLVFRAVGYRGVPTPGVPFDDGRGIIPNREGRVLAGEQVVPRTYVVGWAKRGPSGLIGTNRADSKATVERMLEDLPSVPRDAARTPEAAEAWLNSRVAPLVRWDDWKRLDAAELAAGAVRGKVRHKFTAVSEMLDAVTAGR
jgi:ferredoxin--NADP+ reductase